MKTSEIILLLTFLIVLLESDASHQGGAHKFKPASLNITCFPRGFFFGTASSSYQYEGGSDEGGKGPSIWDTFTQRYPGKIKDHSSGNVAVDQYHFYKEDVDIMKDIGFNAYRFSISWSRLLPRGSLRGGINQEGIRYYNNLINELLSKGIEPFVTIFHWDLPQALEDAYNGFLSPKIVEDFSDYAELCYREFGDRVKYWITLNEPLAYSIQGYIFGGFPPGRCSKWVSHNCSAGDSSSEPYLVAHHQILAHSAAVKVYREKYQMSQKGKIGITQIAPWAIPLSNSKADRDAAFRSLEFFYGWFMEPLHSGSYPPVMVKYLGKRLPRFSWKESSIVKGSYDFIGLNYYTTNYAADVPCINEHQTFFTDSCVNLTAERNGVLIGPKGASEWLHIYPQGIQDVLLYTKKKYNNPVIYITENGVDEHNNNKISLDDKIRIYYISHHLSKVSMAIQKGVKVRGYLAWSLLDNFEWTTGYTVRFGLVFVDRNDGLRRYPKESAEWFKMFLHGEYR